MTEETNTDERTPPPGTPVSRVLTLLYGVLTYAFFFGTFLYLIGFVGNWFVPKSIDTGEMAGSTSEAITINVVLLGLFAIQHTIMARPAFKDWWTRIVPRQIERSTFVLLATALLALMAWQWRPLPAVVWRFESAPMIWLLNGISLAGWGVVLISTFLIDHFELFGLKQSIRYATNRPIDPVRFKERLFYRWVRHPLMSGFLVAFWFTPDMTQGHLLFAVVTTAYILVGVAIEERTLIFLHGERYEEYRRRVPKLLPFGRKDRT